MIPNQADNAKLDFEIEAQPTRTYYLHTDTGRVLGFCDGLEAMRQAVYKILQTERYEYVIYSWSYGVEFADLFGKPIPFVYSEIKRRVSEALLRDDRITNVDNFQFSQGRGKVHATFDVTTAQGVIQTERTVPV